MNMLPPGQDLPMGERATDVISKTLASIPPGKLEEVLMGMKVSSLVHDTRW
jgi:cleavage stimulation factor subunit 2